MAGDIRRWTMRPMRNLDRDLRRRRLLAARRYKPGTIPRRAILGGYWDKGSVVKGVGQ